MPRSRQIVLGCYLVVMRSWDSSPPPPPPLLPPPRRRLHQRRPCLPASTSDQLPMTVVAPPRHTFEAKCACLSLPLGFVQCLPKRWSILFGRPSSPTQGKGGWGGRGGRGGRSPTHAKPLRRWRSALPTIPAARLILCLLYLFLTSEVRAEFSPHVHMFASDRLKMRLRKRCLWLEGCTGCPKLSLTAGQGSGIKLD